MGTMFFYLKFMVKSEKCKSLVLIALLFKKVLFLKELIYGFHIYFGSFFENFLANVYMEGTL